MKDFFQKIKSQGSESGINMLMAMITLSLFGVAIAVSMRLITDQFRGTNSLDQTRGRAQVTKTIADMDCCLTLDNLFSPVSGLVGQSCNSINALITENYPGADKSTITPLKSSSGGPIELGAAQNTIDNARDRGRYLGKWNFSVRCDAIGGDLTNPAAAKYLKILTWRLGNDPLTNEDLRTPAEYFKAHSCVGELNGSKTC